MLLLFAQCSFHAEQPSLIGTAYRSLMKKFHAFLLFEKNFRNITIRYLLMSKNDYQKQPYLSTLIYFKFLIYSGAVGDSLPIPDQNILSRYP